MSKVAKLLFVSACTFTATAVAFVHYRQFLDRQLLHQGIIRESEMKQNRKITNLNNLQTQVDLTKALTQRRQQEEGQDIQEENPYIVIQNPLILVEFDNHIHPDYHLQ